MISFLPGSGVVKKFKVKEASTADVRATKPETPTGKRAFFALQSVITAALDSGWSVDDVRDALTRCATVPSVMQFDRELAKVPQSTQTTPTRSVSVCFRCKGTKLAVGWNEDQTAVVEDLPCDVC